MQLYVAGHNNQVFDDYVAWDFLGVFDNIQDAEMACYDEDCFVGPVKLNYYVGKEISTWPNCWFPKDKKL